MRIGVLVLNYNAEKFLREALNSLHAQSRAADAVVVVDNGSDDDSLAMLERERTRWPELRVVAQRNVGQLAGWQAGLRALADVDIVAHLDSDDWYEPDYLGVVEAEFRARPSTEIRFSSYRCVTDDGSYDVTHPDTWIEGDFLRAVFTRYWRGSPTSMISARHDIFEMLFAMVPHPSMLRARADDLVVIGGAIMNLRRRTASHVGVNYRIHGGNLYAGRPIIPWEEELRQRNALLRIIEPTRALVRSMTIDERRLFFEQEVEAIVREETDAWAVIDAFLRCLPVDDVERGELALWADERLGSR